MGMTPKNLSFEKTGRKPARLNHRKTDPNEE